jgi:transcriptional regulator GlxA family with amidase domain
MPSIDPIRVAIVAYEGVSLLDLSGPLEALRVASIHRQRRFIAAPLGPAAAGGAVVGCSTGASVRVITEVFVGA